MTASKPSYLIFFVVASLLIAASTLVFASKHDQRPSLRKHYEMRRASGKLHPFADAVYQSLLGVSKATATPTSYGMIKDYSPMSTQTNPCASPVTYGNSFGLNTCYSYLDYDTNTTMSNIFSYNSTYGTMKQYNSSNCSGALVSKGSLAINACNDYLFKLLPASSSPVLSTKPGTLYTTYLSQSNCQGNTGKGVYGMTWIPTTTNNCYVYDTVAMMGNSSSWTCVTGSGTYLQYNTSSSCYGQVSYGQTFPLADASCQSGTGESGWVNVGCNA